MRKFQTLKLSQFHKEKTCWTENWWSSGIMSNFWGEFFYVLGGASQCGYVVSTSAFRQGDPGSNPRAARKSCEVYPGLGILQPQWNPYPTLTPPSCWVRHVRSIGDPQYGLVVCCVVSACDSTDSREISNDGNPSLSLHFKLSSLDGAQVVAADAAQRPAWAPSTIYTQHSIFRSPDRKRT